MDKSVEEIKDLFKATNLPDDSIPLYANLVYTMTDAQIEAMHEVLYQLIWERKLVT